MTQQTVTYDDEQWQLMPKVATFSMQTAMQRAEWPGEVYGALLAAAPTPPVSAQSGEQAFYDYVYEFKQPFGVHRSFSARPRNGIGPTRTVKVYTAPPSAESAQSVGPVDAAISETRAAALGDAQYCAGLHAGFQLGLDNDNEGMRKTLESRAGYIPVLRATRGETLDATAPVDGDAMQKATAQKAASTP